MRAAPLVWDQNMSESQQRLNTRHDTKLQLNLRNHNISNNPTLYYSKPRIPPVTILTVKKGFIYKALKTSLTDVLVTSCKYGNNKVSQWNMCSFTWLVQIVTWPNPVCTLRWWCLHQSIKYITIKIWQRFLVHAIFKVSSINIWIHIYSVLLSVVIEWVNMLMLTIVLTVSLGIQYKSSHSC